MEFKGCSSYMDRDLPQNLIVPAALEAHPIMAVNRSSPLCVFIPISPFIYFCFIYEHGSVKIVAYASVYMLCSLV